MGNSLKLNRKKSLSKLIKLSDYLFCDMTIPYELDHDLSVSCASTYIDDYGFVSNVNVGSYEIYHAKRTFRNPVDPAISDLDFVNVVINIYHEYMHCIQKNQMFRKSDLNEYEQRQLVQEIACFENHDYYFNEGNYKINANEIRAEVSGIRSAYEYLCDEFPDISGNDIEHMILNIVNEKAQNTAYFIQSDKPFASLQDVYDAFDDAYDRSFETKRTYMVGSPYTDDRVKQYMRTHPDAREAYLSMERPYDQDRCVAAVNLVIHPNLSGSYPALHDMDLSYETCVINMSDKRSALIDQELSGLLDCNSDYDYEDFI